MMRALHKRQRGFTLIELLGVITILAILSSILYLRFTEGEAAARDTERKADLRLLQNAIELHKAKYGYYPEGCNGPGIWSGGKGSHACSGDVPYIVGLAPEFMSALPYDPRPKGNEGYVYVSDRDDSAGTGGDVYKLMAMETVETELVHYCSEFASCDIKNPTNYTMSASQLEPYSDCADLGPNGPNRFTYRATGGQFDPETYGYCTDVDTNPGLSVSPDQPDHCRMSTGNFSSDSGDGRFEYSYGVWGGAADLKGGDYDNYLSDAGSQAAIGYIEDTTDIICK